MSSKTIEPFDDFIGVRLFQEEKEQAQKVVDHAKLSDGSKKYDNLSNYIRAAVIKLNREELDKL